MAGFEFSLSLSGRRYADPVAGLMSLSTALELGFARSVDALSRELRTFLMGIVAELVRRHGSGWPAGTTTTTLSHRSGRMIESLQQGVAVSGTTLGTLTGTIRATDYARAHEYGAVIRARSSMFLAIPLPAALNADGTPKLPSPRMWRNTFVAKSKAGNILLFQKQGTEIVPLYLLKPQVTLPARLGLRDIVNRDVGGFMSRAVDGVAASMGRP